MVNRCRAGTGVIPAYESCRPRSRTACPRALLAFRVARRAARAVSCSGVRFDGASFGVPGGTCGILGASLGGSRRGFPVPGFGMFSYGFNATAGQLS